MKPTASSRTRRLAWLALPAALWLAPLHASDLTLVEALHRAADHDPTVPASKARHVAERQLGEQERAPLRPSVGAQAAYQYTYSDSEFAFGSARDEYPGWSASVEARQALFRLDWFARGDRADAQDALADAGLEERRIGLFTRVAERYFGVLIAKDNHEQAQAEVHAVRESLENTRKRYDVDLVPGADLKEALARDDLAQARLLTTAQELETAHDQLAETVGSREYTLPKLPERLLFAPVTPPDVESWIDSAKQNNPALVQARHQATVAQTQIRSRRSEAMPQLDLVAGATHHDSTSYVLGQRQDDARIGVELNVPIYAGGLNQARVRQAEAEAEAATATARQLEIETERQTRQQFRLLQTAYMQVRAYERSVESATAAQAATQAGYDAGTRTITDVLDAQSRLVQARRDLNQTRYTLLLNLLQLRQTAGQMTEAHFAAVDSLFTQTPEQP